MPETQKIEVKAEAEELKGRYANGFLVTSQERDVVLDFISSVNMNGQKTAALVSRVFLNRFTVDELIGALQQNKLQWEKMRYHESPDPK